MILNLKKQLYQLSVDLRSRRKTMNTYEALVSINNTPVSIEVSAQSQYFAKLQIEALYGKNSLIRYPVQVH